MKGQTVARREQWTDDWRRVLDADLPRIGPITERTRQVTLQHRYRLTGSVRVALGRFFTDDEFAKYRQRVLSTPLP